MKIFLDTADIEEIKTVARWGVLDGVTTNPTLYAKVGGSYDEILKQVCKITPGPVSAEVVSDDVDGMLEEGRHFATLAPNIVVKVAMSENGLEAISRRSKSDFSERPSTASMAITRPPITIATGPLVRVAKAREIQKASAHRMLGAGVSRCFEKLNSAAASVTVKVMVVVPALPSMKASSWIPRACCHHGCMRGNRREPRHVGRRHAGSRQHGVPAVEIGRVDELAGREHVQDRRGVGKRADRVGRAHAASLRA
jgi:hypothetical protein